MPETIVTLLYDLYAGFLPRVLAFAAGVGGLVVIAKFLAERTTG